ALRISDNFSIEKRQGIDSLAFSSFAVRHVPILRRLLLTFFDCWLFIFLVESEALPPDCLPDAWFFLASNWRFTASCKLTFFGASFDSVIAHPSFHQKIVHLDVL